MNRYFDEDELEKAKADAGDLGAVLGFMVGFVTGLAAHFLLF